ncbi:MAG: hypothetical protein M1825_000175 [Sarcosagium campestre]|nr:MAG: hypothetical protein M1825_000175 [Sarcosagium campestre]
MNPSGNPRHQQPPLNFNHSLLRSLGLVHPSIFARSYTSALISVIHPAPGIRFDGVVGVGFDFGFDRIGGGGGERAARSSSGSGALSGPLDTRAGRDASSSAETGERPGGMRNAETKTGRNESKEEEEEEEIPVAHPAGCNALTIDKFEGR